MESEIPVAQSTQINTRGGAAIDGSVYIQQGDFIGRDKLINTVNHFIQQAVSAAEEAEKTRALSRQWLAEGVRDYAQRLAALVKDVIATASAYKGLLAYRLGDAEIFCGRDQAIQEVYRKLQTSRLTILHAQSGAGKTSLLQAGISPRLIGNGDLPIYVRPYNVSPSLAIKRTFLPNLNETPELEQAPLRSFLRQVTGVLGSKITLYVLLDQFEEVFTLLNVDECRRFISELADCLKDEILPVRWLVALRSDFFSDIDALTPEIENPFANQYRLNRLTVAEAKLVIVAPAKRQGFLFESALVDLLVKELGDEKGEVAPPQLQLICLALYENLLDRQKSTPAFSPVITQAMYTAQGGVQGVLRGYLNQTLASELPSRQERELARQLLVALVSSDQRRIRRSRSNLAAVLAPSLTTNQSLDELLERLIKSRLLNVESEPETDEPSYELVHDYLLTEIDIDPKVQAQKAAQELLAQEVQAFQRFHTLLSEDKFKIIDSQRKYLVLADPASELLRLSQEQLESARQRERQAEKVRRRSIVLGWSLIAAVIVVSMIGWLYRVAIVARQQAQQARNTAQMLRIAAASLNERTTSPQRGLLLALEASKFLDPSTQKPDPEAMRALYAQFDQWPYWQNTLLAHTKSVRSVRFGLADDQLFSVALDGRALEWDISGQARQPKALVALDQAIDAIAVHPTQNWVAVGTERGAIRAISLQAGFPEIRTWQAHAENSRVLALVFSTDGKLLISSGADGVIKLWSSDSLSQSARAEITIPNQDQCVPTGQCWVRTLAISPDGQWLAAGAQNHRLYLWHLPANGRPTLLLNVKFSANVWAVAISHDNAWLTAGDETGTLQIYSVINFQKGDVNSHPTDLALYLKEISDVRALAFSPVENLSAIGDGAGVVGIMSVGESVGNLQVLGRLDAAINTVAFSPSGNTVATGSEDHSVRIWHTQPVNQEPQILRGHTGSVRSLVFYRTPLTAGQTPGSSTLVSAGEDETIRLWASDNTAKPLRVITETGNQILAAAVSLNGRWLATGGRDGRVRLHNLQDARAAPVVLGEHTGEVVAVAFSPDGRLLATGAADQRIYLWPVDSLIQAPQVLDNVQGGILALAFSPDGKFLASGDETRRVKLWELNQSPPTPRLMYTHKDWVWAVTFSPDGHYLASVSADSTLRLTPLQADVAAQGPVFAHVQRVRALAYDPTGTVLASAGDDYTVKLWNPKNLDEKPVELHQSTGIVRALAFSHDGAYLASAGDDNKIQLWTVRLPDLQRMACARTARNLSADEWQRFLLGQVYRATCPDLKISE